MFYFPISAYQLQLLEAVKSLDLEEIRQAPDERETRIRRQREAHARAQEWHDYWVRLKEGKKPAVAETQRDVGKTSSRLSSSSPSQSPLPLPSSSSSQPELQSQSAPVKPVSKYQTQSTFLEPSPQSSCSAGVLQSCVWHWRPYSGNPASPGKRYSTRDASEPDQK